MPACSSSSSSIVSQSAPCSNRPIKCMWLMSVAVTGALVAVHIPTGGREPLSWRLLSRAWTQIVQPLHHVSVWPTSAAVEVRWQINTAVAVPVAVTVTTLAICNWQSFTYFETNFTICLLTDSPTNSKAWTVKCCWRMTKKHCLPAEHTTHKSQIDNSVFLSPQFLR